MQYGSRLVLFLFDLVRSARMIVQVAKSMRWLAYQTWENIDEVETSFDKFFSRLSRVQKGARREDRVAREDTRLSQCMSARRGIALVLSCYSSPTFENGGEVVPAPPSRRDFEFQREALRNWLLPVLASKRVE